MTKRQDQIIRNTISQLEIVHEFVSSNKSGIPAFATDDLLDSLDGMLAHLQDNRASLKDQAECAADFAAMLEVEFIAKLQGLRKKLNLASRQN